MANPISSDNFPARQALKQREHDAGPGNPRPAEASGVDPQVQAAKDDTQLGRANQRLAQEAVSAGKPAITETAAAASRAAALTDLINATPQAAVAAHGRINGDIFEAALARPTA